MATEAGSGDWEMVDGGGRPAADWQTDVSRLVAAAAPRPDAAGRAVPILVPDEAGRLRLDEEALRGVLLQDEVRRLPAVVVSVAGAFRRGKSFLLSLLLRYLEAGGAPGWLGAPDQPLAGFAWRGGRHRHTVGIHLWSRPTVVTLPSGERAAVLLMDTQGAFDDRTVVSENAAVFALSALASSLQIFNVSGGIGTNDLQHLQLFSEFGRIATELGRGPPFQNLLFLVRDWQHPTDAPYGREGGRMVLREVLDCPAGTPQELRRLRAHVRQSFADVDCFLLPHPGKTVATSPQFAGCPNDIDLEFLEAVEQLARQVLSPERLVLKQSGGEPVTVGDLFTHLVTYQATLSSGELPEPRSLVATMSEAGHLAGVARAETRYAELMRSRCSETSPPMPEADLTQQHERALQQTLDEFASTKRMLGADLAAYKKKLMDGIKSWQSQFFNLNKMKGELAAARDGLRCNEAESEGRQLYRGQMLGAGRQPVPQEELQQQHQEAAARALQLFDERTAECDQVVAAEYRAHLREDIDAAWQEASLFNEQRAAGSEEAQRDQGAMDAARRRYRDIMRECLSGGPVDDQQFSASHQRAEHEARDLFQAQRGAPHAKSELINDFFRGNIVTEQRALQTANVFELVIQALVPTVVGLVRKAAGKCVVM